MKTEKLKDQSKKIIRQIYGRHQVYANLLASILIGTINNPPPNDPSPFNPNYLIKKEEVSPNEFMVMMNDGTRDNVLSARVRPPILGEDNDFGSIEVEYRFNKLPNQKPLGQQDRNVA